MTAHIPALLIGAFHASGRRTINKIDLLMRKYLEVMGAMRTIVLYERSAGGFWLGCTTLA